jgi:hypothetical protein
VTLGDSDKRRIDTPARIYRVATSRRESTTNDCDTGLGRVALNRTQRPTRHAVTGSGIKEARQVRVTGGVNKDACATLLDYASSVDDARLATEAVCHGDIVSDHQESHVE